MKSMKNCEEHINYDFFCWLFGSGRDDTKFLKILELSFNFSAKKF